MGQTLTEVAALVFHLVHAPDDDLIDQVLAVLSAPAAGAAPVADAPGSPEERARHAAELLAAAFDSHLDGGVLASRFFGPRPPVDSDYKDAEREPDAHETAQFYAGLSALALARLHRTLGHREEQLAWRERSRPHFLAAYRVVPSLTESRLAIASVFIRRAPSTEDLADYRRRCDELLSAYYAAFAELGR